MGGSGSKSKTQQNLTNNTVNVNTIDNVNKTVMNAGIEVLVENANQCSSAVNQNNLCKMTNISSSGDFNFNSNQSNISKVNFACVNASEASSEMATSMIQSMMGELNQLSGTSAGATLNAAAASENTGGFGGYGTSKSNTAANVTNNLTNETKTRIENIYENNLKSNFNSETVNECIGKTMQKNISSADNIQTDGTANIECVQTNNLEQIQECKQLAESLNKTLKETASEIGFEVVSENVATSETKSDSKTKSINVTTGPIEEIATGMAGIISGIFGIVMAPYIASIVCFLLIILCCVSSIVAFKMMGGKTEHIRNAGTYMGNKFSNMTAVRPIVPARSMPVPTPMSAPTPMSTLTPISASANFSSMMPSSANISSMKNMASEMFGKYKKQ